MTASRTSSTLRGLYAIADTALLGDKLLAAVTACLQGGCKLIQYRDKNSATAVRQQHANGLLKICRQFEALLIVNDDVDLALAVSADGVHLGKNDLPLTEARSRLGENAVIGVSCYNRIELAQTAEKLGADYVAFGSVFSSPTKPEAVQAPLELITEARHTLSLPVCAIGGINASNVDSVVAAGADMVAVITDIFNAENITLNTRRLISQIQTRI